MKTLPLQEFAKLKGVSRQTISTAIKRNKLDTTTIPFSRMIFIVLNYKAKEWKPEQGRRTDLR